MNGHNRENAGGSARHNHLSVGLRAPLVVVAVAGLAACGNGIQLSPGPDRTGVSITLPPTSPPTTVSEQLYVTAPPVALPSRSMETATFTPKPTTNPTPAIPKTAPTPTPKTGFTGTSTARRPGPVTAKDMTLYLSVFGGAARLDLPGDGYMAPTQSSKVACVERLLTGRMSLAYYNSWDPNKEVPSIYKEDTLGLCSDGVISKDEAQVYLGNPNNARMPFEQANPPIIGGNDRVTVLFRP